MLAPNKIIKFSLSSVVSRHRVPQLQVGKNYSYLFNMKPTSPYLDVFILNNSDLTSGVKID